MRINWFKIEKQILNITINNILFNITSLNNFAINLYFRIFETYVIQGYWCKDCIRTYNNCICNESENFDKHEIKKFINLFCIHNLRKNEN